MTAPSLLERALVEFDVKPTEILDFFTPERVRQLTVEMLHAQGLALTGEPATVERLIGHEMVLVAEWLAKRGLSLKQKGRGRRELPFIQRAIYAAAFFRFAPQRKAAFEAAAWLGSPATVDRVEKSVPVFTKTMSRAYTSIGATKDQALRSTARLLLNLQRDLERIAEAQIQDRKAEASRRWSARHAPFSAPT